MSGLQTVQSRKLKRENKKMSKQETELKKGLQVRHFEGSIDQTPDEKDKNKKKLLKFKYRRVVFPWSRTGEDVEGNTPEGAVPSLAETMAFLQKEGLTTEFVVKDGSADAQSIVGLLVDGWNRYENMQQRTKAENTPDMAKQKAIAVYAKTLGISLSDAEKQLFG